LRIADCGFIDDCRNQSTINPQSPNASITNKSAIRNPQLKLERETGIEPATNSLEGCDSTTELLPLSPLRIEDCGLRID
jgi:hypothetical protein